MAKQLIDGAIEYADGTPATASQMAKDVSMFLAWASEPDSDDRKRVGLKWVIAVVAMVALTGYYKRFRCVVVYRRGLPRAAVYLLMATLMCGAAGACFCASLWCTVRGQHNCRCVSPPSFAGGRQLRTGESHTPRTRRS